MKKLLNYLEFIPAIAFIFLYMEYLFNYAATYLPSIETQYLLAPYGALILIGFFGFMAVKSFITHENSRIYPIIFLSEIALVLFVPLDFMTIMFIPLYLYYQHESKIRDTISFIVVGQFLRLLFTPLSALFLVYGWVRYIRALYDTNIKKSS